MPVPPKDDYWYQVMIDPLQIHGDEEGIVKLEELVEKKMQLMMTYKNGKYTMISGIIKGIKKIKSPFDK